MSWISRAGAVVREVLDVGTTAALMSHLTAKGSGQVLRAIAKITIRRADAA
jgi:hypothetical protein